MEFYPKSVYDAIFMVKDDFRFEKPIYITENGVADAYDDTVAPPIHDDERIRYVAGFLKWIAEAIQDGADVRGYYLWSLMDNYEWAAGFSQRFGIVHVNSTTLERTPKESARWYQRVIKDRRFQGPEQPPRCRPRARPEVGLGRATSDPGIGITGAVRWWRARC